jgi:hypothetical protein
MEGLLCSGQSVSIHSAGNPSFCVMPLPCITLLVKFYVFPAEMQMNRIFLALLMKAAFHASMLNNTEFPFWIKKIISVLFLHVSMFICAQCPCGYF